MFELTHIRRQYATVFLRVADSLIRDPSYRFGLCYQVREPEYRGDCEDVLGGVLEAILARHAPAYVRLEGLAYWVSKVPERPHYRPDHAEWRAAKCREIAAAVLAGEHDDVIGADDPPEVGSDIWPYVTAQYLYDTGSLALLKQGRLCTLGGGCAYTNGKGQHCIVGHIMNHEDHGEIYAAGMNEGAGVADVLPVLDVHIPPAKLLLLSDMQRCHDQLGMVGGWRSIKSRLIGVGMQHGLNTQKVVNYG